MISKVLIANRGEIACRVIKSVQAAGLDAVALYSDADAQALCVQLADEAYPLGGNTAAESYLDIDKVIAAAKTSGADAIHPGYGFLSENAEFAKQCEANDIVFIGPTAHAIEVMGNKAAAKRLMLESGVPCIPGYEGTAQDNDTLCAVAEGIGYPLMVKAAAGGGGRGIRLVANAEGLGSAIDAARIEAANAFGSEELILEKAVVDARHIEIQVAADSQGNTVYLGDRDCSVQRRNQKVIEEAPSPFMTEALREAMGNAAINVAKAVNYLGVGTVEFLVDAERNFYFLEMNTRLQVEHPVTEMVTGVDLVDLQLQIAAGKSLPVNQQDIKINGHSIEVRLYAEDPANGFMPQTGLLAAFEPAAGEGVRIDTGVYSGAEVSPYYDSMLAKLITWGKTREEARRRLLRALKTTKILGLMTNKAFLYHLLQNDNFVAGEATTGLINDEMLTQSKQIDADLDLAIAALIFGYVESAHHGELRCWSNSEPMPRNEIFSHDGESTVVSYVQTSCSNSTDGKDNNYSITIGDKTLEIRNFRCEGNTVFYHLDGLKYSAPFACNADTISIDFGEHMAKLIRTTYHPAELGNTAGSGNIYAATDGAVIDVLVEPGDAVEKGDTLVIMEAMKMEHRLTASGNGTVKAVLIGKGQQVKNRQHLVELELNENDVGGE